MKTFLTAALQAKEIPRDLKDDAIPVQRVRYREWLFTHATLRDDYNSWIKFYSFSLTYAMFPRYNTILSH